MTDEGQETPLSRRETVTTSERRRIDPALRSEFERLNRWWKSETGGSALMFPRFMHPAYQQIIGMGKEVVPLLLEEVQQRTGHWFWALQAIAREEIAQEDDLYDVAAEKWLRWGESKGYT
jgi:hypothetical protein